MSRIVPLQQSDYDNSGFDLGQNNAHVQPKTPEIDKSNVNKLLLLIFLLKSNEIFL